MVVTVLLTGVFAALLLAAYCYFHRRWTYKGPPHLIGFPFVGYLPFIGQEPHRTFEKLIDRYGPIFSLYMGSMYTVVLSNYSLVYEAFVTKGNNFSGRPSCLPFNINEHEKSFVFLRGKEWEMMRNFSMNSLKNLAFCQTYTRDFLQVEIQDFIAQLRRLKGSAVNIERMLTQSISCWIVCLFTGKRFSRCDPWKEELISTVSDLVKSYKVTFLRFYPRLKNLPVVKEHMVNDHTKQLKERLWTLLQKEINAMKATYMGSSADPPQNFIHSWFQENEKRKKNIDPNQDLFSDINLTATLDMLLEASGDTTPTLMLWIFLYLIVHPEMQEKIHVEIDRFIGHERYPTLEDLRNLHYTKAFVTEVHRKSTIEPLGIYRRNKKRDVLQGYEIPKNTVVISNLWSVHHDPKYFPDPYLFNPKRFLDKYGKFKPCEYLSCFSFGPRMCPGKSVAEVQVYMYVMSILQAFRLETPKDSALSEDNYTYDIMVARRPKPFSILFKQRHTST